MPLFGKRKKNKQAKTPEVFRDEHLSGAPQSIGNDSANEVYKVGYKDKYAMSGGETTGYFKPNAEMAPAKNAVAASRLAQGMGWGSLIPETKYAQHDVTNQHGVKNKKVTGAVSKAAKGEAMQSPVFDTYKPGYTGSGSDSVKVKADGKAYEYSGLEMNDSLDLSKSNTQKQLNQLQWFDALIGNSDRHGANILIDPETGEVSGIDNDLSFGDGFSAKRGGVVNDSYKSGIDNKMLGLPEQLDEETAATLLGLTPEGIKTMLNPEGALGPQMSDDELQQVYDRLELIQAEARRQQEAGTLLTGWDDATYQAALSQTKSKGSFGRELDRNYIQRHHTSLDKANDTSNPDYWVKGRRVETTTPPPPKPAWTPAVKTGGSGASGPSIGTKRQPAPRATWTPGAKTGGTGASGPSIGTGRQPTTPRSTPPNKPLPPLPTKTAPTRPLPPVPVGAKTGTSAAATKPALERRKTPKVLQNSPFRGL